MQVGKGHCSLRVHHSYAPCGCLLMGSSRVHHPCAPCGCLIMGPRVSTTLCPMWPCGCLLVGCRCCPLCVALPHPASLCLPLSHPASFCLSVPHPASLCPGTSLDEDTALLATSSGKKTLSPQDLLAVTFRLEKKCVLHACLQALGGTPCGSVGASHGGQPGEEQGLGGKSRSLSRRV